MFGIQGSDYDKKKPYNILKVCNMRFIPIEAIVVDEPVVLRHLFLLYRLNYCEYIGYFRYSDYSDDMFLAFVFDKLF